MFDPQYCKNRQTHTRQTSSPEPSGRARLCPGPSVRTNHDIAAVLCPGCGRCDMCDRVCTMVAGCIHHSTPRPVLSSWHPLWPRAWLLPLQPRGSQSRIRHVLPKVLMGHLWWGARCPHLGPQVSRAVRVRSWGNPGPPRAAAVRHSPDLLSAAVALRIPASLQDAADPSREAGPWFPLPWAPFSLAVT